MKILLLINSLSTGGAEYSTLDFYSWIKKKKKAEIKIVCLKKANPEYNISEFQLEQVTYLDSNNFVGKFKNFKSILNDFRPDIVHSVLFEANMLGRFMRLIQGGFLHIESLVSETYSSYRLKDPNVNKLKLQSYKFLDFLGQRLGVDHFHSNGKTVAEHYQKKLKISKSRITIIPRGRNSNPFYLDSDSKEKIRNTLDSKDKIQIICVARHEYAKGLDFLIEGIKELDYIKESFILLLVGREGKLTDLLQKKIQKYNLEKTVKILGHRSDVPALLSASDIFIFPSRYEGLPGALIEAEAAGLPIICSDIPNNKEVVSEEVNALLFPVNDTKLLAEHLINLINDPEKRKRMGIESLAIFNSQFTIEIVHQKMWNLFLKI